MANDPVRVRRASNDDASGIRMVATRTWSATYRDAWSPEHIAQFLGRAYSIPQIVARIERLTIAVFVAERFMPPHTGAIVGYAFVGPHETAPQSDVGDLYALYALPEVHGQGVGYALWSAAADWLREQEKRHMLVGVLEANNRARTFYERQGAVIDHIGDVSIGTQTLSEIWYRADL